MLLAADFTERVLGCVLGGAVGDALGAPFEGLWSRCIPEPAALLADYAEFEGYSRSQYTDDTQLTIATLRFVIRLGRIDPQHIARSISRLWRSQEVVGSRTVIEPSALPTATVRWRRLQAPPGSDLARGIRWRASYSPLYCCDELPERSQPTCSEDQRSEDAGPWFPGLLFVPEGVRPRVRLAASRTPAVVYLDRVRRST
jgi:hypothetical protein